MTSNGIQLLSPPVGAGAASGAADAEVAATVAAGAASLGAEQELGRVAAAVAGCGTTLAGAEGIGAAGVDVGVAPEPVFAVGGWPHVLNNSKDTRCSRSQSIVPEGMLDKGCFTNW